MFLTKDQILAATDRRFQDVDIPEWGGKVRVGTMSALARDEYDQLFIDVRDGKRAASIRAHMVAACLVDESGNRVFTAADIESLGQKSAAPLVRLFDICAELNGLTAKAKEEIAGE